jgi:hypothetical protein
MTLALCHLQGRFITSSTVCQVVYNLKLALIHPPKWRHDGHFVLQMMVQLGQLLALAALWWVLVGSRCSLPNVLPKARLQSPCRSSKVLPKAPSPPEPLLDGTFCIAFV